MTRLLFVVSVFVLAGLAGCGSSQEEEIRQWLVEERTKTRPRVAAIPAPKEFRPQAYTNSATIDPFSNQKLAQALKRDSTQSVINDALVRPELARRKEALEGYPVDAMTLVGSINKAGQPVALIKVENLLYQVKLGHYIGQNFGKVTKINETEVTLREIVQDAAGEWSERVATLQLQEKK